MLSTHLSFPRSHKRANEDTAQDVLLVLYLINKAGNSIFGNTTLDAKIKLMKLTFLAEKEMVAKKYKGFNFFFNIYKRGPSSKELIRLLDDLNQQKLIELDRTNSTINISSKGRTTIKDFMESTAEENKEIFGVIDSIIGEFGQMSPSKIIEVVYAMDMVPMYGNQKINIGDAVKDELKKRLLMRLDEKEAKKTISVSPDWIETINILMNPSIHV